MKTVEEYTEASLNLKCESETHSFYAVKPTLEAGWNEIREPEYFQAFTDRKQSNQERESSIRVKHMSQKAEKEKSGGAF